MPYKEAGTWTGVIQKVGLPRKKKRGFQTKSAAKEWERITLEKIMKPKEIPIIFSQCSTEYLKYYEMRAAKNTFNYKKKTIKDFLKYIGTDVNIQTLNKTDLERYLDFVYESTGGKKSNREMRELRTLFNWFKQRGYLSHNPATEIESYKEDIFIKYVPPPEDINTILLASEGWEYDFIQCLYHFAARAGEIRNLKWDDVNFQTKTVTLWTAKRKGGSLEPDQLTMNNIINDILSERYRTRDRHSPYVFPNKEGGVKSKNTIDKVLPRLCKKSGVKQFGMHAIRHHVSALMADSKKLSLIEIQKQLRHKRATTTDTYLKSIVTGKSKASEVLEESMKKSNLTPILTPLEIKKG